MSKEYYVYGAYGIHGELLPPKDVYSVNRYLKKRCFKLRLSVKDFK